MTTDGNDGTGPDRSKGHDMQRLSGLDATFLYMETPNSPMHVASMLVLDPSTVEGGWTLEKVKDVYRQRLHLAPPFRRRLVEVPFQLHHPVWIEDPDFDLDWHVRHIAVPPPGTREQLETLAAHLMSIPLDQKHPLWEAWIIEGLEDGNIAAVTKVHHAAIDGQAGEEILVNLLDLSPEVAEVDPPEEEWKPDVVPTDTELVGYALNSLAKQPLRAVKAVRRTTGVALNIRRHNREPDVDPPPAPFSAPRTSFNHALTRARSFAAETVSLDDVKMVKKAFGCTVNDVVLALCGTTLKNYLARRGEETDASLVAMVPVSVRTEDQHGEHGNQVSSMLTSLATDVENPEERLRLIHAGTQQAKHQQEMIGADTLQDWTEFAAPAIAGRAARLYSRMKIADVHRPLFNVTISNVPGPPFPLYFAGAKVVATYPMGPIFDGGGLNMTVMSYLDKMDFGLLACPDLIPDVHNIAVGIGEALEEYKKAAAALTPATPTEAADPVEATETTEAG
jgi:diacylglycerol O-acyltransferase